MFTKAFAQQRRVAWHAGVIGNTPMLKPYDCFEYYSAAFLNTKKGTMEGSFQMLKTSPERHEYFDAQIQPFRLIGPK